MKKIDLEQGSAAWHSFRLKHIGASESPIIAGVGFITPYKLWRQKLELDPPQEINDAMRRGMNMETEARQQFNRMMGEEFIPGVFEDEHLPFLSASMDGVNQDGKCVEIKCPGPKAHDMALDGEIPVYYLPQLQKQMYVLDLKFIYYFSYSPENHRILTLERDQSYIDKLIEAEIAFWRCVQELEEPPLMNGDYQVREDEEWNSLAMSWKLAKTNLKIAEDLEKRTRESLIQSAGQSSVKGSGIKLSKIVRKGSVAYDQIPELIGVDLESYRKKCVESWRIYDTTT